MLQLKISHFRKVMLLVTAVANILYPKTEHVTIPRRAVISVWPFTK